MGVGISPVIISGASWNSAAAAMPSGSSSLRNTSRPITARACESTAAS